MPIANLKAAEWILAAGGFGLVILDFGAVRFIPQNAALRLARAAERSNAAVIVMGDRQLCGTFAVLSLELRRRRTCFHRTAPAAPATFDGQLIETRVARNKLGGSGRSVVWQAAIDPSSIAPGAEPLSISQPANLCGFRDSLISPRLADSAAPRRDLLMNHRTNLSPHCSDIRARE